MHLVAEITYNCPAKCSFCPLKLSQNNTTMSLQKYMKALELFSEYFDSKRKLLTISGGEPTTVKELPYYVKIGKKLGYTVTVITNGWNPERVVVAKPDFVQISLDYFGTKHDSIRGIELWNRVYILLKKIKAGKIGGFIRFTLMNDNLDDLKTLKYFLEAMGLNNMKIFAMPIKGNSEKAPSREDILEAKEYAILPSRCPAGKGMFVLTPDMRVMDCIFHRKELGKFKEFTIGELENIVSKGREIEKYPCGEPYWWAEV